MMEDICLVETLVGLTVGMEIPRPHYHYSYSLTRFLAQVTDMHAEIYTTINSYSLIIISELYQTTRSQSNKREFY